MSKIDRTFQTLCKDILENGKEYENKNRGVKRLQIPSYTLRHSFSDGFPAITNKKLYWKGIVGELIWFLRGDNDVKYLNDNGIKIWNQDAYNWYKKHYNKPVTNLDNIGKEMLPFEEFEKIGKGSVGKNYSYQWRHFGGQVDQLANLINDMKRDIMSSRLKVNAWNPSEIFETALPPCHSEMQVIGVPLEDGKFGFELHWNQRSVDTFLGLPFNIASYGLLAKILEHLTGYKALGIEGTLKCVHFYDNQYEAVGKLLKRDPNKHPNCYIDSEISIPDNPEAHSLDDRIDHFKISDFKLIGYKSDDAIKVDMLAPKEL